MTQQTWQFAGGRRKCARLALVLIFLTILGACSNGQKPAEATICEAIQRHGENPTSAEAERAAEAIREAGETSDSEFAAVQDGVFRTGDQIALAVGDVEGFLRRCATEYGVEIRPPGP